MEASRSAAIAMPAEVGTARRALWALSTSSAALLFGLSMLRYLSVHHHTFDLALYARMAWGFVHADGWSPLVNTPFLGVHISLVMGPLALLGHVFGQVPTLLCAQACAFAACVWPMWRLAERRLGATWGWVGATTWLLYPNLAHVAAYEFHPSNLAVLPLCWAVNALDRRDARALWGWGLLAVACREDMGLVVALLGASLCAQTRSYRGIATFVTGGLALALGTSLVRAYAGSDATSLDLHFGVWGGSPLGIVPALWRDPGLVLTHLLEPRTLGYLPMVLAPLALLPLRAPWVLLPALGPLTLNLISTFETTTHFYSHYLTPAVPCLVGAGIVGLGRAGWLGSPVGRAAFLLPLVAGHLWAGGSPASLDFVAAEFIDDARTEASRRVLARIPPGESVQAPDPLLPHLAERREVRRGPPPEAGARWVVLDLSHRDRFARTETLLRTTEEPRVRRWLARDDHAPVLWASPWLLLQRRAFTPQARAVAHYYLEQRGEDARSDTTGLCACLELEAARRLKTAVELVLHARGACPADLAVRLGAKPRPERVDLLFDGVLSPAHLKAGERLRSRHAFAPAELDALQREGLWVGALRSSGAPPTHADPVSTHVPVTPH